MNVLVIPEKDSCKKIINPDKVVMMHDVEIRSKSKDGPKTAVGGPGSHASWKKLDGFVFGSIQMSLFDDNFLLRQGRKEVRLWPFEQYDPRMVC